MNTTLFNDLCRSTHMDGIDFVYVRPGIVATYYLDAPIDQATALVADAVLRYMDFVGPDAIRGYLASNGFYKAINAKRVQRDIGIMRSVSPKVDYGPDLNYSSETTSSLGGFGISMVSKQTDAKLFPLAVTLLQLEFPEDALQRFGVDELLSFAGNEAIQLKAQSGGIGWGLKRSDPFQSEATAAINSLLPRYAGFDPCYAGFGMVMKNKTPHPQWATFIDKDLFSKCGGEQRLAQVAPHVPCTVQNDMAFLRASQLPPIGDLQLGTPDIGALPELARFLAPLRVTIGGLGDDTFDVKRWLARFDDMESKVWDNTKAQAAE